MRNSLLRIFLTTLPLLTIVPAPVSAQTKACDAYIFALESGELRQRDISQIDFEKCSVAEKLVLARLRLGTLQNEIVLTPIADLIQIGEPNHPLVAMEMSKRLMVNGQGILEGYLGYTAYIDEVIQIYDLRNDSLRYNQYVKYFRYVQTKYLREMITDKFRNQIDKYEISKITPDKLSREICLFHLDGYTLDIPSILESELFKICISER